MKTLTIHLHDDDNVSVALRDVALLIETGHTSGVDLTWDLSDDEPDADAPREASRIEESPSYRDSMRDAGRGHLLP